MQDEQDWPKVALQRGIASASARELRDFYRIAVFFAQRNGSQIRHEKTNLCLGLKLKTQETTKTSRKKPLSRATIELAECDATKAAQIWRIDVMEPNRPRSKNSTRQMPNASRL